MACDVRRHLVAALLERKVGRGCFCPLIYFLSRFNFVFDRIYIFCLKLLRNDFKTI
nr:MAG TPA_asm: hypothetical protein [Caudoviricetes sp.]